MPRGRQILSKDILNFPLNLGLGNRIKDDSRKGRKGRQERTNLETRNPKFETNPNDKNTNVINSLEFTFVI